MFPNNPSLSELRAVNWKAVQHPMFVRNDTMTVATDDPTSSMTNSSQPLQPVDEDLSGWNLLSVENHFLSSFVQQVCCRSSHHFRLYNSDAAGFLKHASIYTASPCLYKCRLSVALFERMQSDRSIFGSLGSIHHSKRLMIHRTRTLYTPP